MSDKTITITLEGNDQLTATLKKAKSAEGDLKSAADMSTKSIAETTLAALGLEAALGPILAVVAAIAAIVEVAEGAKFAFEGLVDIVGDLAGSYTKLEEIQSGIDFRYGPEQGIQVMKDLTAYTEAAGLNFEQTQHAASELSRTFKNSDAVADVFKEMTDLATVTGISKDKFGELTQAYTKLAMADSPEKVSASWEKLREQIGGTADDVAKTLGRSPEGLKKALKDGTVSANELDKALIDTIAHGKPLGDLTIKAHDTQLGPQLEKVKTGFAELQEQAAQALFTPETIQTLKQFSDDFLNLVHSPEVKQFFDDVAKAINDPKTQGALKEWGDLLLIAGKVTVELADDVTKLIASLFGLGGEDSILAKIGAGLKAVFDFSPAKAAPATLPGVAYNAIQPSPEVVHANATGGQVVGISEGQAIIAPQGEGLASVGPGERIVPAGSSTNSTSYSSYSDSHQTFNTSERQSFDEHTTYLQAISAQIHEQQQETVSRQDRFGNDASSAVSNGPFYFDINIDTTGSPGGSNNDIPALKSAMERAVSDALLTIMSRVKMQGGG